MSSTGGEYFGTTVNVFLNNVLYNSIQNLKDLSATATLIQK